MAVIALTLNQYSLDALNPPAKNSLVVEITGKQFNWIYRYPGQDNIFGKKYFRNIDDATNPLGLLWEANSTINTKADPASIDDIVPGGNDVYVVKNRPVKLIIGSRDVIHDVGLNHFRMKMDAVPGIPTTLWFTPKFTTKEMKERENNPEFEYEIACDQMCGNGHYSMKGIVKVVTQQEFDLWLAAQKPKYYESFPEKDPNFRPNAAATDTTKATAALKSSGGAASTSKLK